MELRTKTRIDNLLGGVLIFALKPLAYLVGLLLRRDHRLEVRGGILVLKMLGGGSLVLAFPALLAIRRAFPGVPLTLLATPAVKPFAESLRVFDRIILIDDRSIGRLLVSGLTGMLRCLRVDTVIDLEVYSKLTTVISLIVLARNRFGFFIHETFWRKNLHTHLLFFNPFSGIYSFYDEIARRLGAEIPSMRECSAYLEAALPAARPDPAVRRIAVGHACSDMGKERMLTPQQWRQIFHSRLRGHAEVHFLGGGGADRALADRIIAELRDLDCTCHNECGELALEKSLELLATCDEFWGIDSSLLHYARLLGLKCVSYWGPVDPMCRLRPVPGLSEEVHYKKVPCSPCIHITGVPPCGGNNVCIQRLFDDSGDANSDVRLPMLVSFASNDLRQATSPSNRS